MNTPVIFIIFNRPSTTQKVFETIKQAKPEKLYVIADGPRSNRKNDIELCRQTRDIINQVNWPCQVVKDYSEVNLGCKNRVASGITNAFTLYQQAIILEDDCLPNESFFVYCQEMLSRYQDNPQIMSVTGNNFLFQKNYLIGDCSYYFSRYPNIWGWATWKRAWDLYDIDIKSWPSTKPKNKFPRIWTKLFDQIYQNKIDTWDIQWIYACLYHRGLTVVPSKNLVSNIGFGHDSTHTKITSPVANMKTRVLSTPLVHPANITPNNQADSYSRSHFTRLGIIRDIIMNYLGLLND